MKIPMIAIVIAAGLALQGCAIVPAYGPPGPYYSAPAPAIVVQPYYWGWGYGGYGHGGGGRHWR